jgi:predicted pyridoxine 5'-phosphate oxidase superfamily flavin-nucleotide-binding protein
MAHRFAEIAFTDSVKAAQERRGSRSANARWEAHAPPDVELADREASFVAARDSFYLATVGETGWPYVQHRGGPTGFLKVIDASTLAFADFGGNRQYVSVGNSAGDNRVSLFMIDYANRLRLKVLGRMRVHELLDAPPGLAAAVAVPGYRARVERVMAVRVEAFEWNCPQHITPRFTEGEVLAATQPLRDRVAALEAELERLRPR